MKDQIARIWDEDLIAEAVADYAAHYGLAVERVDVCRCRLGENGPIIGFRLSPGDGFGEDAKFGAFP